MFDLHCGYSGLALREETRVVLLARRGESWVPLAAPLCETYDRGGGIDEPEDGEPAFEAFEAWARAELGTDGLEETLEAMRDGTVEWNGAPLCYALVDEAVYRALPDASTPADAALPEALRVPWKSALGGLVPVDLEDTEQYTGLVGRYGCQARVEAAKVRFRDDPAVLEAIAANEASWAESD